MKYICVLNFSNQIGAGPRNIASNFLRKIQLLKNEVHFIPIVPISISDLDLSHWHVGEYYRIPKYIEKMGPIARLIYVHKFLIPKIVRRFPVDKVINFGNYCLNSYSNVTQVTLLHDPYIVDLDLCKGISIINKISVTIKRYLFSITVERTNLLIVQTEVMKRLALKIKPELNDRIVIIPNPVSDSFEFIDPVNLIDRLSVVGDGVVNAIYPSRYYPHKNHAFLIEVARYLKRINFNGVNFIITIDPLNPAVADLLSCVADEELCVTNIGEVNQAELIPYFLDCGFCFFPSSSETFGNSIIEAIFLGLPIIGPDADYFLTLVKDAKFTYSVNSVESCANLVIKLSTDIEFYSEIYRAQSKERINILSSSDWVNKYIYL